MPKVPDNVLQQFNMRDKVCIITGGSRGIGAAVAEGLAEAGANIVIVSSTEAPELNEKAKMMAKRYDIKAAHMKCDVTDPVQLQDLISRVREEFMRIDVFVANAGICIPKPILEQSLEEYHAQMNVNVHGVVYCAKAVGPVFKKQGYGNFIITTSISGRVVTVPVDHTAYNTSKAAALHFGRSLAREWREFARVNMVSPGWIDTEMSTDLPSINEAHRMAVMGRQGMVTCDELGCLKWLTTWLGQVKELKGAYLYLASDASYFVTGSEVTVDGGYTLP